ncbi:Protein of unknown function [Gryllus bimaculatus]|nr:Protein of unknown function [Gryllus bimaculatus]
MCDKYDNSTGPESGKFYKGWAFKYDDLEDMDGGDDRYHGVYNDTDTDLDQGNFSLSDKSSSDLQIHKRLVNKFSERRAVRYKRHFSTTSKCNASDKCVWSTFRSHDDSLSRYELTRLPMGIEPMEHFDAVFGGSLYRKRRQDNESETEEPSPEDLKEKCVEKVKLIVFEYNLRLNVGRIILMGNVADIVTTSTYISFIS